MARKGSRRRYTRSRKKQEVFKQKCTITGKQYLITSKAPNPEELISVAAYYDLNPDKDDRPEDIKSVALAQAQAVADALATEEEMLAEGSENIKS